jgi:hypothetical protein
MSTAIVTSEKTAVFPLTRFFTRARWRTLVTALLLGAVFSGLLAYVQFGTDALAGNDGYYHAKMGWLIRQEGLKPDFPWLPHSILNPDDFYNHHLLYHVYLALFATVDPAIDGGAALTLGAKIASVLLPALAFLAIWWLLRGQGIAWAWLWTLALLAVSSAFLYRMSMPRAQSASLLVLALGLHWLLHGRYRLLLPLGFVYVWLYNAFPLLLVVAGLYVGATWLLERRLAWQALAYPVAGIALGIIVNPYFPENAVFIWQHLLPKVGESTTRVGNEWYPYETGVLLQNSGFALATFVLGILGLGWQKRRIDKPTLLALLTAVFFGFLLFRSRRFVEYFPAFVVIFSALAVSPVVEEWAEGKRPYFRRLLLPLLFLLLLAYPLTHTLRAARADLAGAKPADYYAAAALWLHDHAEPGTHIFQTDWDDFTRLFFYNSTAIYTAGLDPTYMELFDANLYDEWVQVTRGRVVNPSAFIKEHFGSAYVFSDLNHGNFIEQAHADPNLEEVYRDEYAVIFAVR